MARAAILQVEKDKRIELDDDGIIEIISKEVKKRKDSLAEYEKAQRQDLIDDLKREIEILQEYLPEQLSEEELTKIVQQAIDEVGATSMKDMGKIMGIVKPKVVGRADGKAINETVKKLLGM